MVRLLIAIWLMGRSTVTLVLFIGSMSAPSAFADQTFVRAKSANGAFFFFGAGSDEWNNTQARAAAVKACQEKGAVSCEIMAVIHGSCASFVASSNGHVYSANETVVQGGADERGKEQALAACKANRETQCSWVLTACDSNMQSEPPPTTQPAPNGCRFLLDNCQ